MYKIGLTGGIACGKTTICYFLQQAGASIIDTDKIAHELACPGKALWQAYYDHFGEKVLLADRTLNRRLIGNIVFKDKNEKQWINAVSHPLIRIEVEKQINELSQKGEAAAVIDIPLLFETGWDKFVDEKWVVYIDKKTQIKRLRERDGYTFAEARRRIRSQMPVSQKIKYADRIIDTSNTIDINRENTYKLWKSLCQRLEKINEQQ